MNAQTVHPGAGVTVVLPSLDPTEKLEGVVDGLLEAGFTDLVLVNDGSKPENLHFFTRIQQHHPQVTLLHHTVNRGKGAALKTAFRWILEHRPDCAGAVTVDGDGQHHPEDTMACARQLLASGHVVLGVRDFSRPEVPPRSRMGNRITCGVFRVFCGMTLSDTQTGLRAIPRACLEAMCEVEGERFEYETNMLLALKDRHIPFDEVKIRTIYLEENRGSHFRAVRDSWRIYKLILAHFFRYILSSVSCAAVDGGLFALLSAVLAGVLTGTALTAAATAGARAASSLLNFGLNRRLVFRFTGRPGTALVRYYILVVVQYIAQLGLTQGLLQLLHVPDRATVLRAALYVAVMTVLFVLSYVVQQRWVFAHPGPEDERSA